MCAISILYTVYKWLHHLIQQFVCSIPNKEKHSCQHDHPHSCNLDWDSIV